MSNQHKNGNGINNNFGRDGIKKQGAQNNTRSDKNVRQPDKMAQKNNQNKSQKKTGINARNEKAKYSDDEIARARYVDSKAKKCSLQLKNSCSYRSGQNAPKHGIIGHFERRKIYD